MISTISAFDRLREIQQGITIPAGLTPIQLHLGEFRRQLPAAYFRPLELIDDWTRYPPLGGTASLRAAYIGWLQRRYNVQLCLHDNRIAVEPTPGTKQALAAFIALAVARARTRGVANPAVVLPNPYYPTYLAGTEATGAQAVFYTPTEKNHAYAISAAVEAAQGCTAAIIVCNPGNVRGEILSCETLSKTGLLASEVAAMLIVDECYTDLSLGNPPPGYLSLAKHANAARGPFVVLHSLSKRSGTPGLRCGFVAGDPESVAAYASYNRSCGVSTPIPICTVASAFWADDAHVSRLQSSLARNWDLADAIIGEIPYYRRAEAGFFVWLPVPEDEVAARQLWQRYALSVMPGRYLAAADENGVNPGAHHLRIALVHDEAIMREALIRLRDAMRQH